MAAQRRSLVMGVKLLGLGWAAFLGLAPAAWLPGIGPTALYNFKVGLVAFLTIATWTHAAASGRFRLPIGLAGPAGLLMLILAASFGFVQGDSETLLRRLAEFLMPFATLWSFYILSFSPQTGVNVLTRASLLVAALALMVTMQASFGIPGWRAPAEFHTLPLTVVGFEARRTGWSNGVALYGAFALLVVGRAAKGSWIKTSFAAICILAIVSSQYVVGGRAGLVASIAMVMLISAIALPRRAFISVSLAGVLIVASMGAGIVEDARDHLRFDRLSAGENSTFDEFNSFSAGRLGAYIVALDMITESPIVGQGFGAEDARYGGAEIHNLWLRLAVEGGLPLALTFIAIVVYIIVTKQPSAGRQRVANGLGPRLEDGELNLKVVSRVLIAALLGGLLITMFEPRMLIGSFQKSAAWWAAAGLLLGIRRSRGVV